MQNRQHQIVSSRCYQFRRSPRHEAGTCLGANDNAESGQSAHDCPLLKWAVEQCAPIHFDNRFREYFPPTFQAMPVRNSVG
ncbi:hypothetical protein BRAS3843_680024 [Bradyrhizobium sp. STM 3843]|nr:hypothetical protein BRAS3843_680024 [Bradyrhizobium sp. STM 3843]